MRLVVFGTGGVGGFFGGQLSQGGLDVWFVARGPHLTTMQDSGLRIRTPQGCTVIPPGKMTDTPSAIGSADVVLFCVKSYDTLTAAAQLAPLLTPNSIVISLQNGVDNEEKIAYTIPTGTVFGGVAYVYATITAPGEITEQGAPRKLVCGPLPGTSVHHIARGQRMVLAFQQGGVDAEWSDDILSTIWKKFIFIAAVGGLTALTRLTLGEILEVQETRDLLARAMGETYTISQRLGIKVEPDYVERTFQKLSQFPNTTRSSLYHDLIAGKPLEVDALSGAVVRYGESLGIPTPVHTTIYSALLPYARKHVAQREYRSGAHVSLPADSA